MVRARHEPVTRSFSSGRGCGCAEFSERFAIEAGWGEEDEDGIDVFDFTLPGRATDYRLAVYFGSDGTVDHVTMES